MAKKRSIPRRILKWTGITILTLIVLIIIAIVVIPQVVNTGPVKREIETIASESSGRAVTIAGPISLSLFPWIGFDAKDVSMANAAGFGPQPFMRVNELEVHVRLIPLIFRNVQVSGITLDSPTINLARKADSAGNWQDLTTSRQHNARKPASGAAHAPIAQLFIGRLAINDATLDYTDARSGRHYTISDASLAASGIEPGKNFPLNLHFRLASNHPHFRADIRLNTMAHLDAANHTLIFSNGLFLSTITQAGLGAESLPINAQWQSLSLDQATGTASLSGFALQVANMKVLINGKASGFGKAPTFSGHLEVPGFAPRTLFAALGKPIPTTFAGFRQASLTTALDADKQSARLTNLRLRLDDTTFTGSAAITDFATDTLRFNLAADQIDLDQYLAPQPKQPAPVAKGHSKNFQETRLPGAALKTLNLSGQLTIGRLTGFGLLAHQLGVTLKAATGNLSADPITAQLYGGSYDGKLTATATGLGIHLDLTQKLTRVDVGQLVNAISGSERLTGTGDATVSLAGTGASVAELLADLTGHTTFAIRQGSIEGINLWQSLEQAYVLLKQQRKMPITGPNRTPFTNLRGSANLANGVLQNNDLSADLPNIALTGHGHIDFNRHDLDYSLLGRVLKAPKTASADLSQLDGLTVPIRVSGGFDDLSVMPDIRGMIEAGAQSRLQNKFNAQKKSAEDKLKQKLKNLLGGGNGGG